MERKNVKTNLLNHSEAKVRLLGEYLKRYLNIICNDGYTERIKIYDMFCGEGLYENGGEGSPLVFMRTIKDVHFSNVAKLSNITPIDCHFNDLDPLKIEKVKQAIGDKSLYYKEFGEIEYSSLDYQDELKKMLNILSALKNQKAFIFIDPYEYKHIKASQIENLMAKGNAEVLLWLPTQFMYRFAANGTPLALKDFIEELVPYKEWKETDNVWHFINQLKEGFQSKFGGKLFVDTFTIEKDASTVFCLFFFSSHIKGFEKMLEAKWEIDTEQGKGWSYTGNQPSLFYDLKTNPLEEKLRMFLKGNKKNNGEVYEFTLRQGFLPKHTNEILYNWQKDGKLEVLKNNNEKARKSSFYIAYNYYKKESKKVIFKII
ncbi:MAG: three-Cys-motif partner protein TcmP [Chitinophagaceae bacterium]|nr:three-Cys-motif partner protein TcmP [Chitinophagaceae bacterium]